MSTLTLNGIKNNDQNIKKIDFDGNLKNVKISVVDFTNALRSNSVISEIFLGNYIFSEEDFKHLAIALALKPKANLTIAAGEQTNLSLAAIRLLQNLARGDNQQLAREIQEISYNGTKIGSLPTESFDAYMVAELDNLFKMVCKKHNFEAPIITAPCIVQPVYNPFAASAPIMEPNEYPELPQSPSFAIPEQQPVHSSQPTHRPVVAPVQTHVYYANTSQLGHEKDKFNFLSAMFGCIAAGRLVFSLVPLISKNMSPFAEVIATTALCGVVVAFEVESPKNGGVLSKFLAVASAINTCYNDAAYQNITQSDIFLDLGVAFGALASSGRSNFAKANYVSL